MADLALLLPFGSGGAGGGRAAYAQPLSIGASIPAYLDVSSLAPDESRHMPHEFTVDVPNSGGTVRVRMGMAEVFFVIARHEAISV